MRRSLGMGLVVISAMALASPLEAQGVRVGVKGGFSSASIPAFDEALTGEPSAPGEGRSVRGPTGGAFIEVPLTGTVSLQVEAMYVRKGWEARFDAFQAEGHTRLLFDFVEIPALVRLGSQAATGWYVAGGPAFAVAVDRTVQIKRTGDGPWEDTPECACGFMKKTEASLVLEGGVTFARFLIEGRFTLGLTDIVDVEDPAGNAPSNSRSRVFAALVGLRF